MLRISLALVLTVLACACGSFLHAQQVAEINIFYNGAKEVPFRKELARLDSLLNTMDRSRIAWITLVGHADSLFGRPSNANLAEKRASHLKKLLVERHVKDQLITVTSFDTVPPVAEHIVATGRSRNRRVFVRIEYAPSPE